MSKKKILMIPPQAGWYVEAHCEYLMRYLGEDFFMEIAMPTGDGTSPFNRNVDDYDLLWPLWAQAWHCDPDKYAHKVATVFYCPAEGRYKDVAVVGATTPITEDSCKQIGIPYHSLRFGVDTNLFAPYPLAREDDLLHVGYIGNHANVRHMVGPVISQLVDIPGVRIMLFPHSWVNDGGTPTDYNADVMRKHVVTGDKRWTGIPNIYNRMDILLRMDQDPAYSFPTQEAAACGVPVIATDSGIDHLFTDAGAGVMIPGDRTYYMNNTDEVAKKVREAIIDLRDNKNKRKEMGIRGREEVLKNWTWEKHVPAWREFFREGLARA
jgi:glycosyltransferase involved in cell wall biosynthesis